MTIGLTKLEGVKKRLENKALSRKLLNKNEDNSPDSKSDTEFSIKDVNPDTITPDEVKTTQEEIVQHLTSIGRPGVAYVAMSSFNQPETQTSAPPWATKEDVKKLSETNTYILSELKTLNKNKIDEQDTEIKKLSDKPNIIEKETKIITEKPKKEKGLLSTILGYIGNLLGPLLGIISTLKSLFQGGIPGFIKNIVPKLFASPAALLALKSTLLSGAFGLGVLIGEQINEWLFPGQPGLMDTIKKRGLWNTLVDSVGGLKQVLYNTIPGLEYIVNKFSSEEKERTAKQSENLARGLSLKVDEKTGKMKAAKVNWEFMEELKKENILDESMFGKWSIKDKNALKGLFPEQLYPLLKPMYGMSDEDKKYIMKTIKEIEAQDNRLIIDKDGSVKVKGETKKSIGLTDKLTDKQSKKLSDNKSPITPTNKETAVNSKIKKDDIRDKRIKRIEKLDEKVMNSTLSPEESIELDKLIREEYYSDDPIVNNSKVNKKIKEQSVMSDSKKLHINSKTKQVIEYTNQKPNTTIINNIQSEEDIRLMDIHGNTKNKDDFFDQEFF